VGSDGAADQEPLQLQQQQRQPEQQQQVMSSAKRCRQLLLLLLGRRLAAALQLTQMLLLHQMRRHHHSLHLSSSSRSSSPFQCIKCGQCCCRRELVRQPGSCLPCFIGRLLRQMQQQQWQCNVCWGPALLLLLLLL